MRRLLRLGETRGLATSDHTTATPTQRRAATESSRASPRRSRPASTRAPGCRRYRRSWPRGARGRLDKDTRCASRGFEAPLRRLGVIHQVPVLDVDWPLTSSRGSPGSRRGSAKAVPSHVVSRGSAAPEPESSRFGSLGLHVFPVLASRCPRQSPLHCIHCTRRTRQCSRAASRALIWLSRSEAVGGKRQLTQHNLYAHWFALGTNFLPGDECGHELALKQINEDERPHLNFRGGFQWHYSLFAAQRIALLCIFHTSILNNKI